MWSTAFHIVLLALSTEAVLERSTLNGQVTMTHQTDTSNHTKNRFLNSPQKKKPKKLMLKKWCRGCRGLGKINSKLITEFTSTEGESLDTSRHQSDIYCRKVNKQRVTQLHKDRNLILSCMRKKIKWSLCTGIPIQKAGEQLIMLPLAIADHDGNPNKGQKSYMTKALSNRYNKCN